MQTTIESGHATLRLGMRVDEDDESPEAEAIMAFGGWFNEALEHDGPGLEEKLTAAVRSWLVELGYDDEDPRLHISADVYS